MIPEPREQFGSEPPRFPRRGSRAISYAVHFYTASGLLLALLALRSILDEDYPAAFFWMLTAVFVDATDGTLARRYRVWRFAPEIDGRKLDDIVDFVTYSLIPVVMMCHARWLPQPAWLWGSIPLIASVFAFAHLGAKEDEAGFFRGFPSYWNVVAFYVWIYFDRWGPWIVLLLTVSLSALSVMPVWFVYPNKAPRWKMLFIAGGVAWALCLGLILLGQRQTWIVVLSTVYPAFYIAASFYLARQALSTSR
jgi:phosphatidylcholine synthase